MRPRLPLLFPVALLAACTSYVPVTVPLATQGGALPLPGGVVPITTTGNANVSGQAKNQSLVLAIGEERGLATFLKEQPELLLPGAVIWVSTDEKIVSVDGVTGAARALKQGNAIVLGISKSDPNKKFTFDVTVGESLSVLLIKVEPNKPVIKPGEKVKLTAEVRLADGQVNGNVTWTSSDDTVVTVNGTTGEVVALKEGKVTVLATYAADNKYKGAAEVTVSIIGQVASPTPENVSVIFGPDSTPLPISKSSAPVLPTFSEPPSQENVVGAKLIADGYVVSSIPFNVKDNGDPFFQPGETKLVLPKLKNVGDLAAKGVYAKGAKVLHPLSNIRGVQYISETFWPSRTIIEYGDIDPGESKIPALSTGGDKLGYEIGLNSNYDSKNAWFTLGAYEQYGRSWDLRFTLPVELETPPEAKP